VTGREPDVATVSRNGGNSSTQTGRKLPALDGVRALAVALVLADHGGLVGVSGGFVGVDVFFVLSGFLITSLLLAEHRTSGGLDLAAFWARRARRLLPALVVMVMTTWLVRGLFAPDAVTGLRTDALAALLWVANWRFAVQGTDYFTLGQNASPLQHTWSLGVEEQFYLLWPLLISALIAVAARRGGGNRTTARLVAVVAAGGALASACWTIVLSGHASASRVYFGSDCRAQALLVGALAAAVFAPCWPSGARNRWTARRAVGVAPVLGLLALAALAHWASGSSSEYHRGLLTVTALAAGLLIVGVFLAPGSLVARLFALRPLVLVGRVSYGIYLWHWPVFLVLTGLRTGLTGPSLLVLRCLVTASLAVASWVLVEQPVNVLRVIPRRLLPAAAVSILAAAVLVCCGGSPARQAATPAADGAPPGLSAASQLAGAAATSQPATSQPAATKPAGSSTKRGSGQPLTVDVFGDSIGWTLVHYLPATPGFSFKDRTVLGCGVVRGGPYRYFGKVSEPQPRCESWPRAWAQQVAADRPDVVLLVVGRWETMDRTHDGQWMHVGQPAFDSYLSSELRQAFTVLAATGARVVVATEPFNRRGEQPDGSLYPEDQPDRVRQYNAVLTAVVAANPGVRVLDLNSKLGPQGKFTWNVAGVQVRSDGVHLTPEGVSWLTPWLLAGLKDSG
jgi:peptidoglycan/LPS O-acetylase OafA/YrhL